jgi:hypothetical protein
VRALAAFVVVAAGCGPVLPASDRVPVSGGHSTTNGDEGTRPASDAPAQGEDDTGGDEVKLDFIGGDEASGECPRMFELQPLTNAVEVIVDVSQTMATQLVDHDGLPDTESITRWRMLSTALGEWLPVLAEGAELDLQLFPRADAPAPPSLGACESTVGPGLGTPVDELLGDLPAPDATFMQGANPMDLAIAAAHAQLQRYDARTERTILIFTDSAPNCYNVNEPPALFDEVHDGARGWAEYAWSMGIQTIVVALAVPAGEFGGSQGDPIANHLAVLQGIANAGGTALLLPPDATELAATLEYLVAQTRSCRAAIPRDYSGGPPHVEIGGQVFNQGNVGGCVGDAFVYVDNGKLDTIELCGAACDSFRELGTATLVEQCGFPE